eukprot:771617_1
MGDALLEVDLGSGFDVAHITAGGGRTCALSTTNAVKCFGRNDFGQLGLGDANNRGDGAKEMGDALLEVDFGLDQDLMLRKLLQVHMGPGFDVAHITACWEHTCALSTSGGVKCFGRNDFGQLGLGDANNRGDGAKEMGDALLEVDLGPGFDVAHITACWEHTCALSTSGGVKCFGWNLYGQLGLGDRNNRGDGANEMGDHLPEVDIGTFPTLSPTSPSINPT